jgi:hypothetical protein
MEEGAEAAGSEQTQFHLKMGGAEIKFVGTAATLKDTVIPVANKVINLVDSHASLQRATDAPLQIEADTETTDALDVKPVQQAKPASQFSLFDQYGCGSPEGREWAGLGNGCERPFRLGQRSNTLHA